MKKIKILGAILTVWMMLPGVCFGQISTERYIDAGSGDTVKKTTWSDLHRKFDTVISFRIVCLNTNRILELKFGIWNDGPFVMRDSDSLWMNLTDGSTLSFPSLINARSVETERAMPYNMPGGSGQEIWVRYGVTKDQALIMESNGISKIRFSSSRGMDHFTIGTGAGEQISEAIRQVSLADKRYKVKAVTEDAPVALSKIEVSQPLVMKKKNSPSPDSVKNDEGVLISEAYDHLYKAGKLNYVAMGLGLGANCLMVINGGFSKPDSYYWKDYYMVTQPTSMVLGFISNGIMIATPGCINNARKILEPLLTSPGTSEKYRDTKKYLNTARGLAIAAPVLTFSGAIMVVAGFISYKTKVTYVYDSYPHEVCSNPKNNGLEIAGWAFIGAGLLTSVASAVFIDLTKKELHRQAGTLSLNAGQEGIGVVYKFK